MAFALKTSIDELRAVVDMIEDHEIININIDDIHGWFVDIHVTGYEAIQHLVPENNAKRNAQGVYSIKWPRGQYVEFTWI